MFLFMLYYFNDEGAVLVFYIVTAVNDNDDNNENDHDKFFVNSTRVWRIL